MAGRSGASAAAPRQGHGAIATNGRFSGQINGAAIGPDVTATDRELAERLRARDHDALALLYDRHAAMVYGLARAILRDDRLAEEVIHDVFLGLWQRPETYDPSRGAFGGWLSRVTRNRAIDLLRRRRERPFGVVAAALPEGQPASDVAEWLVDPAPDPADQAVTSMMRQEVRQALTQLTPDHRQLLSLAYLDGLTQREIAARLDRPLGTVKTQIRTAMQRLAVLMTDPPPTAPLGRPAITADPPAVGGEP